MKFIGAHVSASGGVENAPLNAAEIGATAFALFTKNQRQWVAKPLSEASVDAFIANLAAHPLLTTGDPVEVEIAGYPGLQADVTASVPAGCDLGAVFLWSLPETSMRMSAGGQARFIALDVDGAVVVAFIVSSEVASTDAGSRGTGAALRDTFAATCRESASSWRTWPTE